MTLTLRKLEYFVAAAEEGQMTGAAARIHVSQSSISIGIAELEHDLGAQLMVRHKARGLTLTAAGYKFLPQARALLAQADELTSAVRHFGQAIGGEFTLGCFTTIAPFVLPELLTGLSEANPPVALKFLESSQKELQESLLDGRCELAILYETEIMAGVDCTRLYDTVPHVIVSEEHPLATRKSIRLDQLRGLPMIALDVHPSFTYFTGVLRGAGVEPDVQHTTSNFEMVRSLVGRNLGYSLLIQTARMSYSYEGRPIVALPIEDKVAPLPVVLAHASAIRQTRRAQAITAYCKEVLARDLPNASA